MHLLKMIVDVIFGAGLFINAVLFIPQAARIVKYKQSKDLSPTTFVGFVATQFSAVLYGYLNSDYILMFGYFLALITCSIVTILIFVYRNQSKNQ